MQQQRRSTEKRERERERKKGGKCIRIGVRFIAMQDTETSTGALGASGIRNDPLFRDTNQRSNVNSNEDEKIRIGNDGR